MTYMKVMSSSYAVSCIALLMMQVSSCLFMLCVALCYNKYWMFLGQRLPNIGIRLLTNEKQQWFQKDIQINEIGEVNLNEFVLLIRQIYQIEPQSLLFYFDHSQSIFKLLNQDALHSVHFTTLICENNITFKCQPKLSDQILANPPKMDEEFRAKRSRERVIEQAFLLVEQWRYFYREGILNQQGIKVKCNLDQSAELIGIPRKTLEDYFLVLRSGKSLGFDFRNSRREKIGILRSYLREKGKSKTMNQKTFDETNFFKELRFQLLGKKQSQELFDILKSDRSHSSSDEDMIFQN